MRRNDHDVTDRIRTTDPAAVRAEVLRLFRRLYDDAARPAIARAIRAAFADLARAFRGEDPRFYPCDTEYHDIQHVLDVTLAMARLMDGYERSRNSAPALRPEHFALGVIAALYHDFGYLRRRADRVRRYGAQYTLTHVSRGARHLRHYLPRLGLGRLARAGATLLHYTGYERAAETIRLGDALLRRIGHMLGTADIIAQMSDRCYLEKCRDRLYPEFVLGGIARRRLPSGREQVLFRSGDDLVRKTPRFYRNAARRLDLQLARAYEYAERHFGGQNLYLEEMHKNVRYAEALGRSAGPGLLRRRPPRTLADGVEPYPKDLIPPD
ncbi:MAG: hypothetical protein N2653_03205 [Burkholderiales bacterium]|nr:hypothetical protein [Burkholderiales bacterium]